VVSGLGRTSEGRRNSLGIQLGARKSGGGGSAWRWLDVKQRRAAASLSDGGKGSAALNFGSSARRRLRGNRSSLREMTGTAVRQQRNGRARRRRAAAWRAKGHRGRVSPARGAREGRLEQNQGRGGSFGRGAMHVAGGQRRRRSRRSSACERREEERVIELMVIS
jgi:hypothetical protein